MNGPPDDVDLSRVWISVAAQAWRRQPGWLERTAGRLLRSPGLARALLTTPSLLLPWLLTSVVVLAAGAAATTGSGQPVVALLAPAVAAAAIAYSYGPGMGAVLQHGGQRPDGALGPGSRGVRGQRRARAGRRSRLGRLGVRAGWRCRGRGHLRLADPYDRGLRLRAGRGDG